MSWETRWPHFKPEEVLSPDCLTMYPHKICPYAMDKLEEFRNILGGVSLVINHNGSRLRGVRSIKENASIEGAAKESMHVAGRAFDITCPTITVHDLFEKAIQSKLWFGIGLYSTWVHVDTRFSENNFISIWTGGK